MNKSNSTTNSSNTSNFLQFDFNDFSFSKKSHFRIFHEYNVDHTLYGKRIEPDDSDIRIYQNLLIYTFVILNLDKGSKIIELGNDYSPVFEKLKLDYECWKFVKPIELKNKFETIEDISDDLINKPDIKESEKLKLHYFDLVYSISALESLPESEVSLKETALNIRNFLKPMGFSINCFTNALNKDNVVWSHKLINYIYEKESTVNSFIDNSKIIHDNDLFIISEKYFNEYLKIHTGVTFQEFGKMYSYNVFWKNERYLSKDNFQEYTYSKKSHFGLFNSYKSAESVYGKNTDELEYDIIKYQELLIYSYIKNNLKKGSKILKIGKSGGHLVDSLKSDYVFYELECVNELSKMVFNKNNYDLNLIKDSNNNQLNIFPLNHFDFVFTISAFDEIEDSLEIYATIVTNITTFKKEFALVLFSFNNVFYKGVAQSNSFIYFLFKNVEKFNKFHRHIFMLEDKDLFSKTENDFFLNENNSSVSVERICYNILWKTTPLLPTISDSRPNDTLKSKPAYVFHHLMKCGGTSVVNSLYNWYCMQFDYTDDPNSILFELNTFHKFKYNLCNLYSDTCLVSHFQFDGYFLPQRYPEIFKRPEEFRIFTFIRDPLKLMISLYYYGRSNIKETTSLMNYINGHQNLLANFFPCNENNYKEVLDRYFFIGIVEQMQESIDKLADLSGKTKIELPTLNISKKDDQAINLSPEFIKSFKEYNSLDYKIYEYCLEKFSKI